MIEIYNVPNMEELYDEWFDPPIHLRNKDIIINTTDGVEVIPIPETPEITPHQYFYDLATEGPTTITLGGGSEEVFNTGQ
tara:strand:+ start:178 stop:417 length:240 start_codon:yes stop_codon:yes gene_type:complete